MNITTFDDRSPSIVIADTISELKSSSSFTSTTASNTKSYKITGDGIAFPGAWLYTDASSDYGKCVVEIRLNGTQVARGYSRYGNTASGQNAGSSTSVGLIVKTDDVIEILQSSTKAGTKTAYYRILCIGCKVEEI